LSVNVKDKKKLELQKKIGGAGRNLEGEKVGKIGVIVE